MEHGAGSGIPPGRVPDEGKTPDAVEVDIVEREIAEGESLALRIACGALIGKAERERRCQQQVLCRHVVVTVASAEGDVGIVDGAKSRSSSMRNCELSAPSRSLTN